jgi:hypothetical protein
MVDTVRDTKISLYHQLYMRQKLINLSKKYLLILGTFKLSYCYFTDNFINIDKDYFLIHAWPTQ